jgi:RNA polymerase sigma-70 factor (ECF subfamily)
MSASSASRVGSRADASDAEDVLQTVFLRIVRRDDPPLRADDAASYLHRAATNASLDLLRRRKTRDSEPIGDAARSCTIPTRPRGTRTKAPRSRDKLRPRWQD